MKLAKCYFLSVVGVSVMTANIPAFGHGGGLNDKGCHNQNSDHTYNCHQGSQSGLSFSSDAEADAALSGTGSTGSTGSTTNNIPAYNRDDYLSDWRDDDSDCMNTRHEVLLRESKITAVLSADGCTVESGLWEDPYTGQDFADPADLDIDHFIPLEEAHDSGAWAWTPEQKKAFANDILNSEALIAVDLSANRSKGSRDPGEWLPTNQAFHCEYARRWIYLKDKYGLSMDETEKTSLELILGDAVEKGLPARLSGWKFSASDVDSTARYTVALSKNNECAYSSEASVGDIAKLTGRIIPEPEHIGQVVDIYVVDRTNMVFTMLRSDDNYVEWDGKVPNLLPYLTNVTLNESLQIDIFAGQLGIAGDHRIFLGYKGSDGILRYSPVPAFLNILP